jgi:hypothetical protein
LYVADTPRYRVLCFQPRFAFRASAVTLENGRPACDISGSGGIAPLKFSIVAGSLPDGVQLDAATGLVRGTPRDKPGTYAVDVEVASATETTRGGLRIELLDESANPSPPSN